MNGWWSTVLDAAAPRAHTAIRSPCCGMLDIAPPSYKNLYVWARCVCVRACVCEIYIYVYVDAHFFAQQYAHVWTACSCCSTHSFISLIMT